MSMSDLMRQIESHSFAARLNVASDFKTFIQIAGSDKAVVGLSREMKSVDEAKVVLQRIIELSTQDVDYRYENQWDTALTVYLWVVASKNFGLAKMGAEAVTQARQCWWASKLAGEIMAGREIQSAAASGQFEFSVGAVAVGGISAITTVGRTGLGEIRLPARYQAMRLGYAPSIHGGRLMSASIYAGGSTLVASTAGWNEVVLAAVSAAQSGYMPKTIQAEGGGASEMPIYKSTINSKPRLTQAA